MGGLGAKTQNGLIFVKMTLFSSIPNLFQHQYTLSNDHQIYGSPHSKV